MLKRLPLLENVGALPCLSRIFVESLGAQDDAAFDGKLKEIAAAQHTTPRVLEV
jgi:hypothetical protein